MPDGQYEDDDDVMVWFDLRPNVYIYIYIFVPRWDWEWVFQPQKPEKHLFYDVEEGGGLCLVIARMTLQQLMRCPPWWLSYSGSEPGRMLSPEHCRHPSNSVLLGLFHFSSASLSTELSDQAPMMSSITSNPPSLRPATRKTDPRCLCHSVYNPPRSYKESGSNLETVHGEINRRVVLRFGSHVLHPSIHRSVCFGISLTRSLCLHHPGQTPFKPFVSFIHHWHLFLRKSSPRPNLSHHIFINSLSPMRMRLPSDRTPSTEHRDFRSKKSPLSDLANPSRNECVCG